MLPADRESMAGLIARLPEAERGRAVDKAARRLGVRPHDLRWAWPFWARPQQLIDYDAEWRVWAVIAGRGFGKTRLGAEATRDAARRYRWLSLVAPTADDVRDIMVEGESGLLRVCPPPERPAYQPSKRRLVFPNGARASLFTADEPERLRGKQHQWVWADEVASWRYPDSWDQILMGLRLPPDPRLVMTGTPKPVRIIRDVLRDPTARIVRGASYDNRANLDRAWFEKIISRYEGTRLGRQELHAELLDDVPGALWTRDTIPPPVAPPAWDSLSRVVLALDPAATDGEGAAEMGIILAGLGWDGRGYVLGDFTTRAAPSAVVRRIGTLCATYPVDMVIAEVNNGGDWIKEMLETAIRVQVRVVHASRGKRTRAEPVAAQYEQGKWVHAPVQQARDGDRGPIPPLAALEDQLYSTQLS